MALLASNSFVGDGVKTHWDFSFAGVNPDVGGTTPYLSRADVRAVETYIGPDGHPVAVNRTVNIDPALPNRAHIVGPPVEAGHELRIFRKTENRYPLVDYRDNQSVSEFDLDIANRQAVYLAQEMSDYASGAGIVQDITGNFSAGNRRLRDLAPGIELTDAVNLAQLGLTLRVPEGEVSIAPLPAAIHRVNRLLAFDAAGQPRLDLPSPGTATELQVALSDPLRGARMVAVESVGGVGRTLHDVARERVSVTDFEGVYLNSTQDSTAGVRAALAYCKSVGADLYWPAGYITVNGALNGIHDVRHIGAGRVVRGSRVFFMQLRYLNQNNLYCAPGGTGDGLSPDQPLGKVELAVQALRNYGPRLEGMWIINCAAGIYPAEGFTFPQGLSANGGVIITGPEVAHPNDPVAILDGGTTKAFGINSLGHNNIVLRDLWLRNYTTYGVIGQDYVVYNLLRTHITDVPGGPCLKVQQGRAYVTDGKLSRGQTGASFIAGTTFTISSSKGAGNGTIISNNAWEGVAAQEQSSGHVDFALIAQNPVGLNCVARSRVHAMQTTITGSVTAAVRLAGASDWYNNGSTLTANTTNELLLSGSIEINQYGLNVVPSRRPVDATYGTHTGTTALTRVRTMAGVMAANNFGNTTKTIRFKITGSITGVAGDKNLLVRLGGADMFGFRIPAFAVGDFILEGTVTSLGINQQTFDAHLMVNAQPMQVQVGSRGLNALTNAPLDGELFVTLANGSDTLAVRSVHTFVT